MTSPIGQDKDQMTQRQPIDVVAQPLLQPRVSDTQIVALSGALAGFLAGVSVCPLDVAKTRLQAQGANSGVANKYSGILGTLRTIVTEEGVVGLYRGIVPIVMGYFPTWMIYFTVYEKAKKWYPRVLHKYGKVESDFVTHSMSAFTAGGVSTVLTNPIWVVKTRLMLQTGDGKSIYKNDTYYKGTFDAFRKMYQTEGLKVFASGLVPSFFGLFHVAIHFPVYEKLKKVLHCNDNNLEKSSRLVRLIAASALSKMCASTLTYPHEILRTRMQIRSIHKDAHTNSLLKTIMGIYHKEGFIGFYSGFATNLARTVPASAVTLVSFEYISRYLTKALS
jgi:solute carrier family 25 folate transporter 32